MFDSIYQDDTIAAIATPFGSGAINVIRVSGKEAFEIVARLFSPKLDFAEIKSHTIHYGKISDENGKVIDDVLISVFKNPRSYTGEDSVEISSHGSPFIAQKIAAALTAGGCRLAEPGEFTKRAFMNGKMDLAQAEAVADLINSRAEASLRGARNQLDGILSAKINDLRKMLIDVSSLVELELDFAEEDIEFLSLKEVDEKIDAVISEIDLLLKSYSFGKVMRDGVNVAIVGEPNVGKSSLLNYLLKESRAIVSDIPGTTRDVIIEEVSIDGILFKLFDTAGLRSAKNEIEREGVFRSKETVKTADMILFMTDASEPFPEKLFKTVAELINKKNIIKVFNKADLIDEPDILRGGVLISAKFGDGIDELFRRMKEKATSAGTYSEKSAVVSNVRHFDALKKSKDFLLKAKETIANNFTGEFIAADMRNAESALGEIIGKVTADDILNNIFENFCIGK
ncbi:MAG: tRNA uridine-5-carboxymethylaminomethyl(34) synthesis GTPase MnmE [Chlorobi bacterium]|nr:tRNA uridine-5-carboxymethylaminomethyl(34) synthesis GTPase MnmE [Chlorobiota bacterium]